MFAAQFCHHQGALALSACLPPIVKLVGDEHRVRPCTICVIDERQSNRKPTSLEDPGVYRGSLRRLNHRPTIVNNKACRCLIRSSRKSLECRGWLQGSSKAGQEKPSPPLRPHRGTGETIWLLLLSMSSLHFT